MLDLEEHEIAYPSMLGGRPGESRTEARVIVAKVMVESIAQAVTGKIPASFLKGVDKQPGIDIPVKFVGTEDWIAGGSLQVGLRNRGSRTRIAADVDSLLP